jgi:hypothetical protein
MIEPFQWLTAWLLGLMGSVHCIGMCGGIVSALSINTAPHQAIRCQLAYQSGRIITYSLLGFIAGSLGAVVAEAHHHLQLFLRSLSGILMILMGFYLMGQTQSLLWLERIGSPIWKTLQPIGKTWIPIKKATHAFPLGMLWGFLPCGLIYSTLSWALASANPSHSALLMLFFGLGNFPILLILGLGTHSIHKWLQTILLKRVLGWLIIIFGLWTLWLPLSNIFINLIHSS